jgi:UDP-N-acetylglucosamine 2-epimerase (non-hydrolysing)
LAILNDSYMVMTDSGGLQEEAITLNKPVIVMRNKTERPEVMTSGGGVLTGTDVNAIVTAALVALDDEKVYKKMSSAKNPFGEGKAANKIVEILEGEYA